MFDNDSSVTLVRLVTLGALAALLGCSAEYPNGQYACGSDNLCPRGMTCWSDGRCHRSDQHSAVGGAREKESAIGTHDVVPLLDSIESSTTGGAGAGSKNAAGAGSKGQPGSDAGASTGGSSKRAQGGRGFVGSGGIATDEAQGESGGSTGNGSKGEPGSGSGGSKSSGSKGQGGSESGGSSESGSKGQGGRGVSSSGDWYCMSVDVSCTCTQNTGTSGDDCEQPKPTCCFTVVMAGQSSCQCWPPDNAVCQELDVAVPSARLVATCPPP